jgi:hypothetical protein
MIEKLTRFEPAADECVSLLAPFDGILTEVQVRYALRLMSIGLEPNNALQRSTSSLKPMQYMQISKAAFHLCSLLQGQEAFLRECHLSTMSSESAWCTHLEDIGESALKLAIQRSPVGRHTDPEVWRRRNFLLECRFLLRACNHPHGLTKKGFLNQPPHLVRLAIRAWHYATGRRRAETAFDSDIDGLRKFLAKKGSNWERDWYNAFIDRLFQER